jgi:hypothetical protein
MSANNNSKNDKSAYTIATYCEKLHNKTGIHMCLKNVTDLCNKRKYDLISFQEIVNHKIIYEKIKEYNSNLNYVKTNGGKASILTIYNSIKFKLIGVKYGDLGKGRPYHIIFFKNKINSKNLIYINLHNGHIGTVKDLEYKLSSDIYNGVYINKLNFSSSENHSITNISNLITEKIFDIIIVGDFNDHNKEYWKKIQPFKYSHINELKNIIVNTQGTRPVKSCCTGKTTIRTSKKSDINISDYILISKKLNYIKNNKIPINYNENGLKYPTSDHLPMESIISI